MYVTTPHPSPPFSTAFSSWMKIVDRTCLKIRHILRNPHVLKGVVGGPDQWVFGRCSLYESGTASHSGSGVFPLDLNATGANPADHNISLWTNGLENSVLGSPDSIVANTQLGTDASTFLLITGSGITANALPFDNSPNSFLNRDTADARTLFLLAPGGPLASGVDISVVGCGVVASGVPLTMSSVVATRLFIDGF